MGKRNLETAVSTMTNVEVKVRWLPFQLRPNTPLAGDPKPPNTPDNPRVGARLRAAGQGVGIDFTGLCDRSPNTLLAHTLMKFAEESTGGNNTLSEILFRHYFTDGLYPDEQNLKAAAEEAGLDVDLALAYMTDSSKQAAVAEEAQSYSDRGISGVPSFFVNGRMAFSGAQPPQAFVRAIEQLA